MSLTTSFRFFRCYTHLPLSLTPTRLPRAVQRVNSLRFLSVTSRSGRQTSVNSKRRDSSDNDVSGDGNGGLITVGNGGENERIVNTELHKEATEAYMSYAMSVLLGRALPDVRDGLKPVHRRIL
ncbi:DNA gyrase subunit A, chloroplastic/mitochondrial [Tanacetum coccineum]